MRNVVFERYLAELDEVESAAARMLLLVEVDFQAERGLVSLIEPLTHLVVPQITVGEGIRHNLLYLGRYLLKCLVAGLRGL